MGIATSAVVDQGAHSGDANRYFRQAFAPWTPETIADDDCDLDPELLLQLPPQLRRGTIRIHRQQDRVPAAIHVRYIHAAVGANESVPGFGDQHMALASDDATTLAQGQFTNSSHNYWYAYGVPTPASAGTYYFWAVETNAGGVIVASAVQGTQPISGGTTVVFTIT